MPECKQQQYFIQLNEDARNLHLPGKESLPHVPVTVILIQGDSEVHVHLYYWLLLHGGIVKSVLCTATISGSAVRPHLRYNHS
jgi:hypothetical protein